MNYLHTFWQLLIAANPQIRKGKAERNRQLIITLLLTLVPYGIIITTLQIILTPEKSTVTPGQSILWDTDTLALIGGTILWSSALVLIIRGYFHVGTFLALGTAIVAIMVSAATDGDLENLPQMVLPMLIGAMLFPLQEVVIMFILSLAGLLALPVLSPLIGWQDLVTRPFSFCFVCMILIYLAFRHRELLERERQSEIAETEIYLQNAQKLESLGALAGGIAHDFNNLLAAMMGQISVALIRLPKDQSGRENLEKAQNSARRAAELTRSLLSYAGRDPVERELLNLNRLIDESRELFDVLLPRHDWLTLQLDSELPFIEANPTQMRQILMNLIINASEAIDPKRGIVTVSTQAQTIDKAVPKTHLAGHPLIVGETYIKLQVTDNGSGIEQANLSKVFDPFFTTKKHGTGFGLSATLGIVRSHKGAIQLQSKLNQGTIFSIFLPIEKSSFFPPDKPDSTQILPSAQTTNASQLPSGLLIIDDEQSVLEAVRDILSSYPIEIWATDNGQSGIETFTHYREKIQVVLLDVRMPGLNGAETFAELRKMDPLLPIIFATGYSASDQVDSHIKNGEAGYLAKPFSSEQLIAVLQLTYLQRKS